MSRPRPLFLLPLLPIGLLFAACQVVAPAPVATPSPVASPSPVATPLANARPTASSEPLSACDPASQAAAMRSGQMPDWEALNLPACYQLRLEIDPQAAAYTGSARVTYTNRTPRSLPDLVFRTYPNADVIYGGALDITTAWLDGEPVSPQVFLSDQTAVRLNLPAPLPPGETIEVELTFRGQVSTDFGDLPDVYGVFNYASATRMLTLANWYPLLAVYEDGGWRAEPVSAIGDAVVSQMALYQVQVSAPAGWQVVTTGSQVSERSTQESRQWEFVSGPVREFTVVASPNFSQRNAEVDGVTIRHWGLPGGESRWQEALQATADSLTLFDERFGRYPYAELDVVAAPMKNASGVEYPGLFLVIEAAYAPNPPRPFFLGLVVSHEVAHQWWYGVVGNDVLTDPWQDEALAVFSSLIYQQIYQPGLYQGTLAFYQGQVEALAAEGGSAGGETDGATGPDTAIRQPVVAFEGDPRLYGVVVYQKGGVFFEQLRQELGDEVFFQALQAYYAANRYRLATPQSLLKAFEDGCGCQLDDFYRQWGVER